jgi:hypothetical protein
MKKLLTITLLALSLGSIAAAQTFSTLRGTRTKVETAYKVAVDHDYTFMKDGEHVEKFVRLKLLVRLSGDKSYSLSQVSHPFIRPAGRLFIERFCAQCKRATGKGLVVTSATRTLGERLWNSSSKSVHPAGIAIDFRIPKDPKVRSWVERNLLIIQSRGDIIATHERNPPHYHIVVVPKRYEAYVAKRTRKKH